MGPLTFEGGYPSDATVAKLYDEMDFQRAVQCYMWAIPIVSFAKWQEQHEKVFARRTVTSCRWRLLVTNSECSPRTTPQPI